MKDELQAMLGARGRMEITFTLNYSLITLESTANETLLRALRRHGYFGVKHGCENRNSNWRNVYIF